jgi:cytochrome P450
MMAANPHVQRLAQEEIARAVGTLQPASAEGIPVPARLPGFGDREQMPYLEAVFKEVMRFNPGLSMGESQSIMHALERCPVHYGRRPMHVSFSGEQLASLDAAQL